MAHDILVALSARPAAAAAAAGAALALGGALYLRWRMPDSSLRTAFQMLRLFQASPHKSLFSQPPSKEAVLLETVLASAPEGDAQAVMDTIDKFGYEHWMMNVGDEKGAVLDAAIKQYNPKVMVELGAYCGYSAVRAARLLQPGALLISIEANALCCAITTKVVEHAGLASKHKAVFGTAATALAALKAILARRGATKVDLFFIDHDKRAYLSDLKLLEASGVIRVGTVLVADNVIVPGAPDYLEYVRGAAYYTSTFTPGYIEYQHKVRDGIEISVCTKDPPTAPAAGL
eukprot:m.233791 g.233791  ORF g.233791 m.233791 type:complete len:289 (-) comp12569_c0_seq1:71-937(-)